MQSFTIFSIRHNFTIFRKRYEISGFCSLSTGRDTGLPAAMKYLRLFLLLVLAAPVSLAAQQTDSAGYAPFEVTVTNFDNEPQPGERIVFEGLSSGTVCREDTDAQ